MKLNKNNKFVAIIGSFAIALSLSAYTPNNAEPSEQVIETAVEYAEEGLGELEKVVKEKEEYLDQKLADKTIEDYIDELYESMDSFYSISENFLQPENLITTYENISEKGRELFDFVFNGKEINGYTFKDLSEDGKQTAREGLDKVDSFIEKWLPNYKERFHNWTVERGADAVELWEDLQDWYYSYKEDVLEEYDRRTIESASNRIIRK
ncbi:MAG: hypothetical protein IKF82_01775 [Bacilli bacterium]|nr:hypothetical protein [Bacilli bacterium]MBR3208975.1 hypothetical protein [Bacilli bacterium]